MAGRHAASGWIDLTEAKPANVVTESIGWLMGYRPIPIERDSKWEEVLRLPSASGSRPIVIGIDDSECLESGAAAQVANVCLRAIAERPGGGVVIVTVATDRLDDVGSLASRLLVDGPTTVSIELGPLSSREVSSIITSHAGVPPDPAALHALCLLTDGLPRRVTSELQRGLTDGGLSVEGRRVRAAPEFRTLARGPTGLVDRALARYDTLEEGPRARIDLLACCGPALLIGDAARVLGIGRNEVDALVASSVSLLEMDDARVWFVDGRVHAAVLARTSPTRRLLLVRPVASRLATSSHGADLVRAHQLLVLAEGPEAAVERLRLAEVIASDALASGCWSDAFYWYGEIIESLGRVDCAGVIAAQDRPAALLFGGAAAMHAGDGAFSSTWFAAAKDAARSAGLPWMEGLALLGACRASILGFKNKEIRELEPDALAYVDQYGSRFPSLCARICGVLAERCFDQAAFARGATLVAQGRALLGGGGAAFELRFRSDVDPDVDAGPSSAVSDDTTVPVASEFGATTMLDFADGLLCFGDLQLDRAYELFSDVSRATAISGDDWVGDWARARRLLVLLGRGSVEGLGAQARSVARSASSNGSGSDEGIALMVDASAALVTGDLRAAERNVRRATSAFEASDYRFGPALIAPLDLAIRLAHNDRVGAVAALSRWGEVNASTVAPYWLTLEAAFDAVRDPGVRASLVGKINALVEFVGALPVSILTAPIWALAADCLISIEISNRTDVDHPAVVIPGLVSLAGECAAALGEIRNRRIEIIGGGVWSSRRLSAGLAALAGDEIGARRQHRDAVARTLEWAAGPELVRSLVQSAVFLGDGSAALEALTVASQIELAGELARVERVVARFPPAPTSSFEGTDSGRSGLRFIVFSDLVNSTGLNAALGDRSFVQLLERHDRVVRARLAKFGGIEFKHTGDGIAAEFARAEDAARFSCGLQADLSPGLPGQPDLRVRVGIAAGHPIRLSGDRFGMCVVHAARLCALGDAGMVLAGTEVVDALRTRGFEAAPFGRRHLKGFPEPELVWVVSDHGGVSG